MAAELIISISGMRGIVGENLTPSIAAEYGCAFGTYLRKSDPNQQNKLRVCIGRDSRVSGQMLLSAVSAGLSSAGIDVIDLGVVSTPGVGVMQRHFGCAGGVVITASHNTIQYNGIKLLLGNGIAPPATVAEKIKNIYLSKDFDFVKSVNSGALTTSYQTDEIHLDKVLVIVDKDAIAAKKFKVVLDSVNGAGGRVGKKLLEILGCQVVAINNEATGLFAHAPEPIRENLTQLCETVTSESASVGFAQDPDADRLAIVDENGEFIGEEYTLALAAKYIYTDKTGPSATNLSTSRMIDDIAVAAGSEVIRTAVGEANVAEAMVNNDCIIGGEGNGGVIDLRVGPIRDSLVGMALVLALLADSGKTISQMVDQIGGYHMHKGKLNANKDQAAKIIDKVKTIFTDAKIDTTDGCRFDFDDGWVHLRTSNTEPIMRTIVETTSEARTKEYIDKIAAIGKEIVG